MFAENLKRLREAAGLTQAALAERLSLPLRAIQNYEQGVREPSIDSLVPMAQGLGVTVDVLLTGQGGSGRTPKALPATPPAEALEQTAKRPKRVRERSAADRRARPPHSKGVIGDRRGK